MKKNGIYGYWDTQKECVVYIGKDSNISSNSRDKDHHTPSKYNEQQINRILQNNKGRYTYFILCDGNNKHGFRFVYWFYDNNMHENRLSSTSIDLLKDKMIKNGHDFIVLDNNKYQKVLQDSVNPENRKYTLWDISCVEYKKDAIMRDNSKNNPRKCFALKFNSKTIRIGINFFDFTSIEIIDNLIKEAM